MSDEGDGTFTAEGDSVTTDETGRYTISSPSAQISDDGTFTIGE